MLCKGSDGERHEITSRYFYAGCMNKPSCTSLSGAYVAAITVCNQGLNPTLLQITGSPPEEEEVVPTVTTDEVEERYSLNMSASGTITDEGSSPITEYGWVWSYSETPTIEDNKVIVGTESFTGSFTQASDPWSMEPSQPIYVRAYATNDVGTGYGNQLVGEAGLCLIEGTLVTLADMSTKPIEEITYDDDLLVWDFDEGNLTSAKPLWICKPIELRHYRLMKFSDGSDLAVAAYDKGHRIFNLQSGSFTNLNTSDTPFGTQTVTDAEAIVELIGDEVVEEKALFYNVITDRHINLFANGILTSCKLNNIYPIGAMRFIKDDRLLRDRSEFDVIEEVYEGLRLAEQPDYVGLKEKAQVVSRSLSRSCVCS